MDEINHEATSGGLDVTTVDSCTTTLSWALLTGTMGVGAGVTVGSFAVLGPLSVMLADPDDEDDETAEDDDAAEATRKTRRFLLERERGEGVKDKEEDSEKDREQEGYGGMYM